MRFCACGCGRPVRGKFTKRYASIACRQRARRRREATESTRRPLRVSRNQIQNAEGGAGTPRSRKSDINRVTPTDTNVGKASVHCRSCGTPLPKIIGPLPCPAYCKECVAQRLTPSDIRPPWHAKVYGGRR